MSNIEKQPDNLLIQQVLEGSQFAFNQLFEKYYDYAFDVALLYCTYHDAEEVISDVFARIWNNRQQLQDINNFKSYLFISLKNQSFNYLRKRKIDTVEIDNTFDYLMQKEMGPQAQLELSELNNEIEDVISNLPPKCKEAFKLVREEGLRYKDAAKRLSITENTLDVHLKKATRRIIEVIKNYGLKFLLLFSQL